MYIMMLCIIYYNTCIYNTVLYTIMCMISINNNSDSFFDLNLGITRKKFTIINCINQDAIAHIRFMFFLIEL